MKIALPVVSYGQWACIQAEIIDVAPHLAHVATFAVHRNSIITRVPSQLAYAKYGISNVETGRQVFGCDAETRTAAIENARHILERKSVNDVMRGYEAHAKWEKGA